MCSQSVICMSSHAPPRVSSLQVTVTGWRRIKHELTSRIVNVMKSPERSTWTKWRDRTEHHHRALESPKKVPLQSHWLYCWWWGELLPWWRNHLHVHLVTLNTSGHHFYDLLRSLTVNREQGKINLSPEGLKPKTDSQTHIPVFIFLYSYYTFIQMVLTTGVCFYTAAHLCVNPPRELRLRHHDDDAKHAEDEGVVAEALALFKQCPPMAELVANVLVPFVRCVAGILAQWLARLVAVALWHHDLEAGGVERLQRLGLRVQIGQVPAAQRSHHAAIVLAAVHGYLRDRGAAGQQRRARPSMAQPAAIRTHLTHKHTGDSIQRPVQGRIKQLSMFLWKKRRGLTSVKVSNSRPVKWLYDEAS